MVDWGAQIRLDVSGEDSLTNQMDIDVCVWCGVECGVEGWLSNLWRISPPHMPPPYTIILQVVSFTQAWAYLD